MATNTTPEVARTIVNAVVYCADGASAEDIVAAFPSDTPPERIENAIDDLVLIHVLLQDRKTHRYFATEKAARYVPSESTNGDGGTSNGDKPTPSRSRTSKRSGDPTTASSEPLAKVLTPVVEATVRHAAETIEQATRPATPPTATPVSSAPATSSGNGATNPPAGESASATPDLAAAVTTAVVKPVTKLAVDWVASAPKPVLIRLCVSGAIALVFLAVLQHLGAPSWLLLPAALLCVVGIVAVVGPGRAVTPLTAADGADAGAERSRRPTDEPTAQGTARSTNEPTAQRSARSTPESDPGRAVTPLTAADAARSTAELTAQGTARSTNEPTAQRSARSTDESGTRSTRRYVLAAGCFIVVAGTAAGLLFYRQAKRPAASAVSEYLTKSLAPLPVKVVVLDLTYPATDGAGRRIVYRGVLETTEPLFHRIDSAEYLHSHFATEISAIEATNTLLRGPGGPRIRARLVSNRVAERDQPLADLDPRVALAPAHANGQPVDQPSSRGASSSRADESAPRVVDRVSEGLAKSAANPPPTDASRSQPASGTGVTRGSTQEAQDSRDADLAANSGARSSDTFRALELLGDRDFHDLVLVTTQTPPRTTLSCSGVVFAWRRDGEWVFTSEASVVDRQKLAGLPKALIAGSSTPSSLVYAIDTSPDEARLRSLLADAASDAALVKSAANAVALEIDHDRQERIDAFAQLLRTGTVFSGTYTNTARGESHAVALEITGASKTTHGIAAILRNDGGWSDARSFAGEWSVGDDSDTCVVTLRTRRQDAVSWAGPLLADDADSSIVLSMRLDGSTLPSGPWQFRRVDASDVGSVKAEFMRAVAPALAATTPGATYRGTVTYRVNDTKETLILRFTDRNGDGSVLRATLQSTSNAAHVRHFSGMVLSNTYRSGGSPIRLQSVEDDAIADAVRFSILRFRMGEAKLALHVEAGRLVGQNQWYEYEFEKLSAESGQQTADDARSDGAAVDESGPRRAATPLTAADSADGGAERSRRPTLESAAQGAARSTSEPQSASAATSRPTYPTAAGVYVLSGGVWIPLRANTAKRVQNAAKGILNLLNDLNLVSDSDIRRRAGVLGSAVGEIAFSDAGPVPTAAANEVIIVAVGATPNVPADVLASHPELRSQPAIEMARAKTRPDGTRYAPLVEIVPGFQSFGQDAVMTLIEQPSPGVTLLRSARPLTAGRYIVWCGMKAYEMGVE